MQEFGSASKEAEKSFVRFKTELPKKYRFEIPNDEKIVATIQGRFDEWLVCTNKQVHIIKSGFPTGRVGKIGHFEIRYENIVNAFVEFRISLGYFDIIEANMPHTRKTYWGTQKSNPQTSPDSIGLDKKDVEKFEAACAYINARSVEEKELYSYRQDGEDFRAQIGHSTDENSRPAVPHVMQQDNQSMKCPTCGSTNLQVINEVHSKGVSGTKVCLFGLCGLCGAGKTKNVQYWVCQNCGHKFKA